MAYTTINKGSDYFNTKLYTGNGSNGHAITGVGFQPDLVWGKSRSGATDHYWVDAVRGATKVLRSNFNGAEYTQVDSLVSFDTDGFTLDDDNSGGASGNFNVNAVTYASWNWLAANGTSANTDGDISSTVSANTTSGFSIVTWTGDGVNGASVGHGLSQAPEMIIVKNRTDASTDWRIGQTVAGNIMTGGNGYYMELNDTKASTNPGSAVTWGSPPLAPTSSVFYVGSNNSHNGSGDSMLCYCFHSVKGFSKIGSYIGNGNANGAFVYTGFRPAFVIYKKNSSANDWIMKDSVREPNNQMAFRLKPNSSNAEDSLSGGQMDFLSNGFKARVNDDAINGSGGTYLYMAFAEHPFVSSTGTPVTAR